MIAKFLRISDIQTSELLYYDPAFQAEAYKFCKDRDIDCLPALDDENTIYIRDDETQQFRAEPISDDRKVESSVNIFTLEMLERFRVHPLQLVFTGKELTGVVHFADYGKPIVSMYLYEMFFAYEKALRKFLILNGFGDADMLAYFERKTTENSGFYKKRIQDYDKMTLKEKRAPFEVFMLTDLLALISHKDIAKLGDVGKLRNMVMHAHELVNMDDPYSNDYIYKYESFQNFFTLAIKFMADYKRVKNLIAFTSDGASYVYR